MHLAARALCLALVPSIAAAQAETRYPATQQAQPRAASVATPDASRYLVVACPAPAGAPTATHVQPPATATRPHHAAQGAPPHAPTNRPLYAPLAGDPARPDTEAALAAQPPGPPEAAIDLLMRLAEAPAPTDAPMAHPARGAAQDEHGDHDEHAHDALRSADEKGSGEDPDAPFAPQFKIHLFADMKYAAIDTVGSRKWR